MPEEINRIVCDHVSTLLFTPTVQGIDNLKREGFNTSSRSPYSIDNPGIFLCGDVMYDNSLYFAAIAEKKSRILETHKLEKNNYVLVTVHREQNTDDPKRLNAIFAGLNAISDGFDAGLVIPLHPRTAKILEGRLSAALYKAITDNPRIRIIPAVSYLDMVQLEKNASLIMTDSGGVQKEAYFFKGKCIVLRAETEWTELVDHGMALLADANTMAIVDGYKYLMSTSFDHYPPIYGNGTAAEFICSTIIKAFK
jgi:UDP-GlcNAc3NAcA epimerase